MKQIIISILMIFVMTVAVGILYPIGVWALSQAIFPAQANGSLIVKGGSVVGSELIGQNFTSPGYFHSRPSAAGSGYDAAASGGSNLGPTSQKLIDRITDSSAMLQKDVPETMIPADLVTTSASGLDPDISPQAAEYQIERVAKERGIGRAELRQLVADNTLSRTFGISGEPRVNVVLLNLKLDEMRK